MTHRNMGMLQLELKSFEFKLAQEDRILNERLSEQFLRKNHPECEEAFLKALEYTGEEIRARFIQRASDVFIASDMKMADFESKLADIARENVTNSARFTERRWEQHRSFCAHIDAINADTSLTDDERVARVDGIIGADDEASAVFQRELEKHRLSVSKKIEGTMDIPKNASDQLESQLKSLLEHYAVDCEKRLIPLYEEFFA